MLAAAVVLWLIADASVERLSVSPPGTQDGVAGYAGVQITQPVHQKFVLAFTGRAGAVEVDAWQPIFEGSAELWWQDAIGVHLGARHDDRLRREGALVDYRDPTGRLFAGVTVLPLHKGAFAAGASIDYDRAMPGVERLPSGVRVTALGRLRWRRGR